MPTLTEWPRWPGATVAVLAGAPSLTRAHFELVERAHAEERCKVIAVNRSYVLAPWADILYGNDIKGFWKRYPEALEFAGLKLCGQSPPDTWASVFEIPKAPRTDAIRFDKVGHYYDSGFDALQIAAICIGAGGCVLACGFDARPNGHWHDGYDKKQLEYEEIIPLHQEWMHVLGERDTIVLNCSEGSAIDAYPRARLEDVL